MSPGEYQLDGGSTYTVTGKNVAVIGGNADGVRFSSVRGTDSLVVDKEVGEGDFSAEGSEDSTMTLGFELEGKAITASGTLTTEITTMTEVTE